MIWFTLYVCIGAYLIYLFTKWDEDYIQVKHIGTVLFFIALWPLLAPWFLYEEYKETVVIDFRKKEKKDEL